MKQKYNAFLFLVTLIHLTHGQRRFIIDNDNDLNRSFAFPIDLCFQSKFTDTQFVQYSCSQSGNSVTKRIYTHPSCKSPTDMTTWTTNDKSPCGGTKFSCIGEDQYQNISYFLDDTCRAPLIEVPIVIGCFCDSNITSYSTNCIHSPESGNFSFFADTTCSNSRLTNSTNSTMLHYNLNQCNEVAALTDNLVMDWSADIYAKQTGCYLTPPTSSPTVSPVYMEDMTSIENLSTYYQYTAGGFVFIFGIIAVLSFIDATVCRINDYYSIGAIVSMILQTIDMMSDCFFTAEIGFRYKMDPSFRNMIMLYASMGFIIIPSFIALFQLYFYAKKHWIKNDNDYVRHWLSKYSTFLLCMSLITGSSFAAVSLLNSYIFQIQMFDMGLTKKQLKGFNTRRIWSVVVLENMPQLLLQSYYFWIRLQDTNFRFDTSNLITVSSMFFSIISMIITLMSVTIENAINKTQDYIIISMDITGDCMDSRAPKCRTMKSKLTKYISRIIGVDMNMIEIVKPMYIAKGLSLDIIIYVNDNNCVRNRSQMYKILIQSNQNGKLPKLLQKAWKLKGVPLISSIIQQTINCEQTKKTVSENNIKVSENIGKNHGIQNNLDFSDEVRRDSELINYIQKQNHAIHAFNIGSYNQVYTASNTAANSRKHTLGQSYDHKNMSMVGSIINNNNMLMEGCENKEHTPTPPPPPPPAPPAYNPEAKPAFVNKMSSKKRNIGIEMSDAQSKISEIIDQSETYNNENRLVMSDNKSLEVLNNMGYMNKQKNMKALKAGDGNLSATIQYLIDNEKENDIGNVGELEVSITIDSQFNRGL